MNLVHQYEPILERWSLLPNELMSGNNVSQIAYGLKLSKHEQNPNWCYWAVGIRKEVVNSHIIMFEVEVSNVWILEAVNNKLTVEYLHQYMQLATQIFNAIVKDKSKDLSTKHSIIFDAVKMPTIDEWAKEIQRHIRHWRSGTLS